MRVEIKIKEKTPVDRLVGLIESKGTVDGAEVVHLLNKTPLLLMAKISSHETVLSLIVSLKKWQLVRYLLEHNIDIAVTDHNGCGLLHYVAICINNKIDLQGFEQLWDVIPAKQKEALLKIVDTKDGNAAMHYAAIYNNRVLIEWLLAKGISVNQKNILAYSALHYTCGNLKLTKYLLEQKADLYVVNINGRNVLQQQIFHLTKLSNANVFMQHFECFSYLLKVTLQNLITAGLLDQQTKDAISSLLLNFAKGFHPEKSAQYVAKKQQQNNKLVVQEEKTHGKNIHRAQLRVKDKHTIKNDFHNEIVGEAIVRVQKLFKQISHTDRSVSYSE